MTDELRVQRRRRRPVRPAAAAPHGRAGRPAHHRGQARHRAARRARGAAGRSLHRARRLARREPGRAARRCWRRASRSATSTTTSPARFRGTRGWRPTSISAPTSAPACSSIACSTGGSRVWAVVGMFGDSLTDEARALAAGVGIAPEAAERLQGARRRHQLQRLRRDDRRSPRPPGASWPRRWRASPIRSTSPSARPPAGASPTGSARHGAGPAARAGATGQGGRLLHAAGRAWARRASGTLANDLAKAHAGSAVAIVSPKSGRRLPGVGARAARIVRSRPRRSAGRSPRAADGAPRPASTTCRARISKNSPTRSSRSSARMKDLRLFPCGAATKGEPFRRRFCYCA